MSPKYWEPSLDLNSDSSDEDSQDHANDANANFKVIAGRVKDVPSNSNVSDELEISWEEHSGRLLNGQSWRSNEGATGKLVDRSAEESAEESIEADADMSLGNSSQALNAGALSRAMAANFHLPALQPPQHASLFYLSLIEGRCRTQAAFSLNSSRLPKDYLPEDHPEVCSLASHLFAEMSKELAKAGMLPDEFIGRPLAELRLYLSSFDAILNTITSIKRPPDSGDSSNQPGNFITFDSDRLSAYSNPLQQLQRGTFFRPGNVISFDNNLSVSSFDNSRALVRHHQEAIMLPTKAKSIFNTEYKQLHRLGKGGYGTVWKVLHREDKAEYAVKQIRLDEKDTAHLSKEDREAQKDLLRREVQSHSKLDHRNVARYLHCWIEKPDENFYDSFSTADTSDYTATKDPLIEKSTRKQIDSKDNTRTDPDLNMATLSLNPQNPATLSRVHSFSIGIQRELEGRLQSPKPSHKSQVADESNTNEVIFGDDSTPVDVNTAGDKLSLQIGESPSERATFSDSSNMSEAAAINDRALVGKASRRTPRAPPHYLYIKMKAYPLTLQDFISESKTAAANKVRHCFHVLPTVRLLLAILEGIQYLHRQYVVHRDLKPANIFLDMLPSTEPDTPGFVHVSSCNECHTHIPSPRIRMCPVIGDFGLAAKIEAPTTSTSSEGATTSALIKHSPPKKLDSPVGTALYMPPFSSSEKLEVCEKLDVYSLGIIAFELCYKFGTLAERAHVLEYLRSDGIFPNEFCQHPMLEVIAGMLQDDRDKRWDSGMVKQWLSDLERQHASEGQ